MRRTEAIGTLRTSTLLRLLVRVALVVLVGAVLITAMVFDSDSGPLLGGLSGAITVLTTLGESLSGKSLGRLSGIAIGACGLWLLAHALPPLQRRSRCRELPPIVALGSVLIAVAAAATDRWLLAAAAGCIVVWALASDRRRQHLIERSIGAPELLLAILLAASVVRYYSLAEQAPGFGSHATGHLALAIDLYERVTGSGPEAGEATTSLIDMIWPRYIDEQHGPMAMVNALGFGVFGIGFVEARMTQALLGVITIWLAYRFGKRLVDERVGLTLALLLAFEPWHIAVSRFNDAEHVLAPLQLLLALDALLRAVQTGRRLDHVIAGACCALGWYVYATNQVLLIAVLAFAAWLVATRWRHFRTRWHGPVLFGAAFVVLSLPHLVSSHRLGKPLPIRSGMQGIYEMGGATDLLGNLGDALGQLFVLVDDQWYTRAAGGGLSLPVAALFVGGLAWCVVGLRFRDSRDRSVLLLLWLVIGTLPAVILGQVEYRRLLLVALVATVLVAVLLAAVFGAIVRCAGRRRLAWPLGALGATALVGWAALNLYVYFDQVRVPESSTSTYFAVVTEQVRAHAGHGPTVIVLPPEGHLPEHQNAVRLGAYERVSPLIRAGTPRDQIYQFVGPDQLSDALVQMAGLAGPVHVVAASYHGPGEIGRIGGLVRDIGPVEGPSVVQDALGRPAVVVWSVSPPDQRRDPQTSGDPAAGPP
jgi:hypothetical protein